MPTITHIEFWNPNPKLNLVFFKNYIETKLKDIQQTQRQNSISDFWPPNKKLNPNFLMLFEKPNTKLKTQIPNR